jgi:hypothetical protein
VALETNKMTVPGRVDSANDRRTDGLVVGSIQPLPLLATYGDMEDRSFFQKGLNKGAHPDAVSAPSGGEGPVA